MTQEKIPAQLAAENSLFEIRKIRGKKKNKPMVLSVVTFRIKIALDADLSQSTVTYCGCLGAMKKKQPAEETTNWENTSYYSSLATLACVVCFLMLRR